MQNFVVVPRADDATDVHHVDDVAAVHCADDALVEDRVGDAAEDVLL